MVAPLAGGASRARPSDRPADNVKLEDVVPVVAKAQWAVGQAGRTTLKRHLDSGKGNVLQKVAKFSEEHRSIRVASEASGYKAWDPEAEELVSAGIALNCALGTSKDDLHATLAKALATRLVNAVGDTAAVAPSVLRTLLSWISPHVGDPLLQPLFDNLTSALVSRTGCESLPDDVAAAVVNSSVLLLPNRAVTVKFWQHAPYPLFYSDLCLLHDKTYDRATGRKCLSFEHQANGVVAYCYRLGIRDPVLPIKELILEPCYAVNQALFGSQAEALSSVLAEYASEPEKYDPAFFFVLLYPGSKLLPLLLELADSVLGLDNFGVPFPPRLLNVTAAYLAPTSDPFYSLHNGVLYPVLAAALRTLYISAGVHLAFVHAVHSDSMNARLVASSLYHILCVTHNVPFEPATPSRAQAATPPAPSVEQVLITTIRTLTSQGPRGASLPTTALAEPVFVNTLWYFVLSLLSSPTPASLPTMQYLVVCLSKSLVDAHQAISVVVTAVGQMARRARPGVLELADTVAEHVLLKGGESDALKMFLFDSCAAATNDLPPHVLLLHKAED